MPRKRNQFVFYNEDHKKDDEQNHPWHPYIIRTISDKYRTYCTYLYTNDEVQSFFIINWEHIHDLEHPSG